MATEAEIPKTMVAAVITAFNEPIQIHRDVSVPDVPTNRVLVKVEASSLCSSDLMAYKGYMPFMTQLPYCGGHEPVGTIVKVGSTVKGFAVGERVGFMMFKDMCGICAECFSGQHRYCAEKQVMGFKDSYGGFSEYALADPVSTVKLPDGLSFDSAAPLFCAGITAYSALLKVKSPPGELINIVGSGGVGHIAIKYAKAMGYRVNACRENPVDSQCGEVLCADAVLDDIAEDKLDLARECGADQAINSITGPKPFEKALSTIVISGANAAYAGALDMTANHGAVLAVGLPPQDLSISVPVWSSKDVTLIPCNTGSKAELVRALDLAVRHNIQPKIEIRHIETINEGYKDLADGKIDGRIVYHFH